MRNMIDRRGFLRASGALTSGIGLASLSSSRLAAAAPKLADGAPHAEKLGWRLGALFNCFPRPIFHEAIDGVARLGLRYVEGAARCTLSKEKPDVHLDDSMSAQIRAELKRRLADAGVKLVSYYSHKLSGDEQQCRREFEFAKDMRVETLVAEPPPEALDMVETLSDEYRINVAIHNHTPPSRYWNPDSVLEVCEGRSKRVGACGDTGQWTCSGVDPIQAIKKLAGRIISFHLKDMNKHGSRDAHEVAWGTGKGNIKGMIEEVHRLGLKPLFIIEYHHHGPNLLSELAQCVEYFDAVAAELLARQ